MTDAEVNRIEPVEFSFALLLRSVSKLHFENVVKVCELVLAQADRRIAQQLDVDAIWFSLKVRGFLFFLTTGQFLPSAKPDALIYRGVVEALVDKGELKTPVLEAVDREIEAVLGKRPEAAGRPDPSLQGARR